MNFNFDFLKKTKKADLPITILLLLGIVIVINFLSYQIFYRLDLTKGGIYSISSASKKIVSNLEDIVNIKVYFSDNLTTQFISVKQDVADILDEYEAYSNGKVRVEFVDPGDDEEIKKELYLKGIPQLTFQVFAKDQAQTVNGYAGIAVEYGDQIEVIPAVKQDTSDLEYQLTIAIKKATSKEIATIGYVTSNKTADPSTEAKSALTALRELYNIEEVKLDENIISDDIKTLIIFGPKEGFTEEQLKKINSFIVRGGSLFVLLDGVVVNQSLLAQINSTNLDKFLEKYGVKVNKNLVADVRNGIASFSQGSMAFSVNYPFWPRITNDGFNKNISAVSSLENVIMPWASSIDIDESKVSRNDVAVLAFSSDKAWQLKDNFNIAPAMINNVNQASFNKFNLAVTVNGILNNVYSENENNKQFNGRMTVVADSDFATDNFFSNNSDNQNFFLNLVDGLSLDQDLINIRSKNVASRPIKEGLSDSAKATMRYLNIFGITVIVVSFGLVRYYFRRRSRFVDSI